MNDRIYLLHVLTNQDSMIQCSIFIINTDLFINYVTLNHPVVILVYL